MSLKLIAVHGNIGSGKSTYIKNNYGNSIVNLENLDYWKPYFDVYCKLITKIDPLTDEE